MDLKGHIATSLFTLYRFPFEGKRALKYLDASAKGVFRSFYALVLAAPIFALLTWLQFRNPMPDWFTVFHGLGLYAGYVLATMGFAFLVFHAFSVVGPRERYLFFLPLYNWGRILTLLIWIPYLALKSFGFLEGQALIWGLALSAAAVLLLKFAMARAALEVNYFHGFIFVAFDLLLMLLVGAVILDAYLKFQ